MILVAGTKRSGTSMWMQILRAAGLPIIGEAFPRGWEASLKDANPSGFYESSLRQGVNFTCNPDPQTGVYLHPSETTHHAVKVFLPGLVRSDIAFVHRALITVREWRAYCVSVQRLEALERGRDAASEGRPAVAPALEWWVENWLALRDVLTRRYSCHLTTYDTVLANPAGVVPEVLQWIGAPAPVDAQAAVAAVDVGLRTDGSPGEPDGLQDDWIETFDDFYQRVRHGEPLDPPFLQRLNALHRELTPLIHEHYREAQLHRGAAETEA